MTHYYDLKNAKRSNYPLYVCDKLLLNCLYRKTYQPIRKTDYEEEPEFVWTNGRLVKNKMLYRAGGYALFLVVWLLCVFLTTYLAIMRSSLFAANGVIVYLWWREGRTYPYVLRCPRCGATCEGTVLTYLVHIHDFERVYKRCPTCSKYGWLTAINVYS